LFRRLECEHGTIAYGQVRAQDRIRVPLPRQDWF